MASSGSTLPLSPEATTWGGAEAAVAAVGAAPAAFTFSSEASALRALWAVGLFGRSEEGISCFRGFLGFLRV